MIGSCPVSGVAAPGGGGTGDVLWAAIQALQLANEVMNFPGLEGPDGGQPEWWEVAANCALTEEDVAGEGVTENYERCLKIVTTANSYGYQRYTYADQPRIKSGRPLSAIFAVWSVGGVAARIRLQSNVGSLGVSADTVTAGWTILTVEGVTLDGVQVDIRCEVDNGTAYFVPLGINIGAQAVPLRPRGLRYKAVTGVTIKTLSGLGDEAAWNDIDVTANSSPLAAMAHCSVGMAEDTDNFSLAVRLNTSTKSSHQVGKVLPDSEQIRNQFSILLDDSQIFEYFLDREAGAATLDWGIIELIGFWEWE